MQRGRIERMPSLKRWKLKFLVCVPQWFRHTLATFQGFKRLTNHTSRTISADDQVGFQALVVEMHGFPVVA